MKDNEMEDSISIDRVSSIKYKTKTFIALD